MGSARGGQLLVLAPVHAGPESAGHDRARRARVRLVPAGRGQLRAALPELEERRRAELLSRVVSAGRLARQRAADGECRTALRLRRASNGTLRPDVVVRPRRPVTAGRCRPRVFESARRSAIRRGRRQPALAVRRRLEQPRAARRRGVSTDAEDGAARRDRAILRAEHAGRPGNGRTVRVPRRDAVGRHARQPHADQPAAEPVSAGLPSGARRDRRSADGDRRPRGSATAGHDDAVCLAVERHPPARAAGRPSRRSSLRRQSRPRAVARR